MIALHDANGVPCLETLMPESMDTPENRKAVELDVMLNALLGPAESQPGTYPELDSWDEVDDKYVDALMDLIFPPLDIVVVVV